MSFLQFYSREDSSKSNQFFREKYLYFLPRFIENASIHVYTFFCSLSISSGEYWSVYCYYIFEIGDLYLNLSKHDFSLYCSVTKVL
jgi:hypothetical protein